jgi:hypothetical protein
MFPSSQSRRQNLAFKILDDGQFPISKRIHLMFLTFLKAENPKNVERVEAGRRWDSLSGRSCLNGAVLSCADSLVLDLQLFHDGHLPDGPGVHDPDAHAPQ